MSIAAVLMVAVGVTVAVVSGGGDDRGGTAARSPSTSRLPQAPPVEQGPPDRDPAAVTAALDRLDACALLDTGYAKAHRNPNAVTIPSGPHACSLVADPNWIPGYAKMLLTVGAESDGDRRYLEKPVEAGGAKAYEFDQGDKDDPDCVLDLPVSFTRSIQLEMQGGPVNPCHLVEDYGAVAVAKLASPDALAVDTAKRPFSAWDGCTFLTALTGQDLAGATLGPNGHDDPFSGCTATRDGHAVGPTLEVAYGEWYVRPGAERPARVGGKDAALAESTGGCHVRWNQGPSGNANKWFASVIFDVGAGDCDTATRLAAQAIPLAGQPPARDTAKPQRPLLYGRDDNDTGKVGACVDLINSGCAPYRGGATVPPTFEAAANASRTNQAVQCEAFQDAVKTAYGPSFAPVTWGDHCVFVEPTHAVLIWVDIDGRDAPREYRTSLDDPQVKQVGGKQTVTGWSLGRSQYDVYYSPYDDVGRKGNLHIHIEADPPRGALNNTPGDVPLDPGKAQLAEQVIAQVAQQYFR